jgi:hypothetical protein
MKAYNKDYLLNYATPRSTDLTEKLTNTLAMCIEPDCTLPCSQEPADTDYLSPDKSTIHTYRLFI